MKNWIKEVTRAFKDLEIFSIKKYTLRFAQQLTKSILNNDNKELKMLVEASCEIRDEIEFEKEIMRNKEFYFGYWYAYENIGRRILDFSETNNNINHIVATSNKLRNLIKFLGSKTAARQKDIAEHLNMMPDELANFMCNDFVKKADILSENKIGRNMIYSLNSKGKRYYDDYLSEKQKNYIYNDELKTHENLNINKEKISDSIEEDSNSNKDLKTQFFDKMITNNIAANCKQTKEKIRDGKQIIKNLSNVQDNDENDLQDIYKDNRREKCKLSVA